MCRHLHVNDAFDCTLWLNFQSPPSMKRWFPVTNLHKIMLLWKRSSAFENHKCFCSRCSNLHGQQIRPNRAFRINEIVTRHWDSFLVWKMFGNLDANQSFDTIKMLRFYPDAMTKKKIKYLNSTLSRQMPKI